MPVSKPVLLLTLMFTILSALALPSLTLAVGATLHPAVSNVAVNLLVDYGNGTRVWYNGTIVPSNSNFYNVTILDTNVGAVFFASFGSHFVYSLNGAGCPADNIFCENAWSLWTIYGGCTQLSQVGVDQLTVAQARTVAWFLTPAETSGETSPTGEICSKVDIDVKPGTDPAHINRESSGTIPVALLSNPSLDATTAVVRSSLTFGHKGLEQSLVSCNVQDVNGDGLQDLICRFDTGKADFLSGDTTAILNGQTTDGNSVFGTDSIVVF